MDISYFEINIELVFLLRMHWNSIDIKKNVFISYDSDHTSGLYFCMRRETFFYLFSVNKIVPMFVGSAQFQKMWEPLGKLFQDCLIRPAVCSSYISILSHKMKNKCVCSIATNQSEHFGYLRKRLFCISEIEIHILY